MKTSTQILKEELPIKYRRSIENILNDSLVVYNDLIEDEIFKGEYFSNIKGWLMTYIIDKHFDKNLLPNNFGMKVNSAKMPFNRKRVEIKTDNMLLTISRTDEKFKLPCESAFRKEYALGNDELDNQIKFSFNEENIKFKEEIHPYYSIVVYKVRNNEFEFIDVLMPDSNYKSVIGTIPLKSDLVLVKPKIQSYESILSQQNLKKKVLEDLNKDVKLNGHN